MCKALPKMCGYLNGIFFYERSFFLKFFLSNFRLNTPLLFIDLSHRILQFNSRQHYPKAFICLPFITLLFFHILNC